MKHGQEKSDLFIVALKPANKPGRPGAESVEPRERTEGNTGEQHTCRTLRREACPRGSTVYEQAARGLCSLITQGGSPVRESRPPGSVRGAPSNGCPYRERKVYIQPINGLCATKGSIPFVSYPVNFIKPIQPITNTRL